jgi:NTE family protein
MLLEFLWRRDFLISASGIRKLVDDHLPFKNLEDAKMPIHIVATDTVSGGTVILFEGSASDAIVASAAIPGAFAPLRYRNLFPADGAISNNTPIKIALDKGAERLFILPTGSASALHAPPMGAVANALHALTQLISRQLTTELEHVRPTVEYHVAPPPLVGSPYELRAPTSISTAPAKYREVDCERRT